jgi:hypothetical protein
VVRGGAKLAWWSVTGQLLSKLRERRRTQSASAALPIPASPNIGTVSVPDGATDSIPTTRKSLMHRFESTEPLRIYPELRRGRRVSIVTDSVNSGLLYGGVGTAILLGTLLAKRIGADLRLITRYQEGDPGQLGSMLAIHGIAFERDIECVFSPPSTGADVSTFAGDLFLTTSWWSTKSALMSVDPEQIIYLIQEDERMFYPRGDDRLRCSELLGNPNLRFVVNSEMLLRHFGQGEEPLPHIALQDCWFEPAFPSDHYYDDVHKRRLRTRRNFLYYARPNNLRNLYWRGLEAIAGALEEGMLHPEEWNFIFVGRDLDPISLPGGVRPTIRQNLTWLDYAALVREIDVGLSLIDTPHPSYPPLDLASSGAVVVTNTSGIKTSLARYSENILCVDPSVGGLKEGIRCAVALASDEVVRSANYARNGITRDWSASLEPVVRRCAELVG